eukprot:817665-Rhodomonas_salina.2
MAQGDVPELCSFYYKPQAVAVTKTKVVYQTKLESIGWFGPTFAANNTNHQQQHCKMICLGDRLQYQNTAVPEYC